MRAARARPARSSAPRPGAPGESAGRTRGAPRQRAEQHEERDRELFEIEAEHRAQAPSCRRSRRNGRHPRAGRRPDGGASQGRADRGDREPGQAGGGHPRPRHRARGQRAGRAASSQDHHPWPSSDSPASRPPSPSCRPAPAQRRHEGPHHRPRGPQHPRLRGDHRRQPHHRRHPGSRAAVLLRSGPPRGRRLTLESLVLDGRIHPHRIEEVYDRSKAEVESPLRPGREDALVEVGITDMHPELVALLGRCATARRTARTSSSTWSSPRTSPA